MRGIELPVNTLVIMVLAVIVLVAVVLVFFGVWEPFPRTIGPEAAKNAACLKLVSTGCGDPAEIKIENLDVDEDGRLNGPGDNLQALCAGHFNAPGEDKCKELCGC